jgi:Beta-lactamase enzyme family
VHGDIGDRFRDSALRSRDRRAARPARSWLARIGFVLLAVAGLAVPIALVRSGGPEAPLPSPPPVAVASVFNDLAFERDEPTLRERRERRRERRPDRVPTADAWQAAVGYAEEREGLVSFATIDSRGRLRGERMDQLYSAASIVKAMVLAAELRRLAGEDAEIDESTDGLLTAMITASDNEAADTIYARVGDEGMHEVAKMVGMTGFTIAGHWGNAQVTAADMARFFAELDQVFPPRFTPYAQNLLASVIESQRWGIPAVAGERWAPRFKGGWLPDHALVHQAAELRERGGPLQISLAVMTDEQPSHGYGVETVEGVAARLLAN